MSRKIIKIGKLALVTLLIMSMLSSTVFAAQASAVTKLKFRTAVVTQMELKQGSAEVARAQEVIPMYDGMRLSAGDTLRTIGEAVVYIMIDQDKIIRLDANSEAELTNTLLGSKVKITLKKGSMFFNVVEKLTEDESLQFVYGNVTMSVRGTSGSLAGAGTAFGVMLYDGKIEVTGTSQDGKQQEPMQVTPGQKYEVSQSADGKVVEKVTPFTLNEIPKSVIAELAKDPALKERVADGVPVSISPSGAVYVKADQINTDVIGTPDEKAGQFSQEIAQNAGIQEEPKQQQTGSDEPESTVTCQYCGKTMSASTYQAETGHRILLVCGHHVCEAGDHGLAACGKHDKCAAGYTDAQHARTSCGHYACEAGTHELCECGVHYKCQIAEADWTRHVKAACGTHYICGEGYAAENHALAVCGTHYVCEANYTAENHEMAACGKHYKCEAGVHSLAECGEHYQCEAGYTEAGHKLGDCGHYACKNGDHDPAACGKHFKCAEGYTDAQHEELECRVHYKCQAEEEEWKNHVPLDCGHCEVDAEDDELLHMADIVSGEYPCQNPEYDKFCPQCDHYVKDEDAHLAPCGDHYVCAEGYVAAEHKAGACGKHYKCEKDYGQDEDHKKLDCGHYACEDGNHVLADCQKHWKCSEDFNEAEHAICGCGHAICEILADKNWKTHLPVSITQGTVPLCALDDTYTIRCPLGLSDMNKSTFLGGTHCHYDTVTGYVSCNGYRKKINGWVETLEAWFGKDQYELFCKNYNLKFAQDGTFTSSTQGAETAPVNTTTIKETNSTYQQEETNLNATTGNQTPVDTNTDSGKTPTTNTTSNTTNGDPASSTSDSSPTGTTSDKDDGNTVTDTGTNQQQTGVQQGQGATDTTGQVESAAETTATTETTPVTESTAAETTKETEKQELPKDYNPSDNATWPTWFDKFSYEDLIEWFNKNFPYSKPDSSKWPGGKDKEKP